MENIFMMSAALQTSQSGQEEPGHLAKAVWVSHSALQGRRSLQGVAPASPGQRGLQGKLWQGGHKHQAPEAGRSVLTAHALCVCDSPTSSKEFCGQGRVTDVS